jgi:hypothetical protein
MSMTDGERVLQQWATAGLAGPQRGSTVPRHVWMRTPDAAANWRDGVVQALAQQPVDAAAVAGRRCTGIVVICGTVAQVKAWGTRVAQQLRAQDAYIVYRSRHHLSYHWANSAENEWWEFVCADDMDNLRGLGVRTTHLIVDGCFDERVATVWAPLATLGARSLVAAAADAHTDHEAMQASCNRYLAALYLGRPQHRVVEI